MAANYILGPSQSTIQVISPTVIQDVVVVTIQTLPSKVIASLWVSKKEWDDGNTAAILTGFAANIETILASPKVESAFSGPALDASGLQATEMTFTVAYDVPGSRLPPATLDVTVPSLQLLPSIVPTYGTVGAQGKQGGSGSSGGASTAQDSGVTATLAAIDAAYAQLAAAAGA